MPRLPTLPLEQRQLPVYSGPRATPQEFGYGVGQSLMALGDTFTRIQAASDEAEARQTAEATRQRIEGTIQQNKQQMSDPDEFYSYSAGGIEEINKNALDSASNDRVRGMIQAHLQPYNIKAQKDVEFERYAKKIDVAKGNSARYMEDARRRLSSTPYMSGEYVEIKRDMATHLKDMERVGAYTPAETFKIWQDAKEEDSFNRAVLEMGISPDPLGDFEKIGKKYDIDPSKTLPLLNQAQERLREVDRQRKDKEKQEHDANLSSDMIDAVNGRLTRAQLDSRAMLRKYDAAEYIKLGNAMESGGFTDPQVYTSFEQQIREGKLTDLSLVATNTSLDRQAKSTLMGLMQQAKDDKHFSKTPEYQEASKELRSAVSPKGPMESFDKTEQARYLSGMQELWNRVGKGEEPMAVSRDIQGRIAREPTQGEKPLFLPRFQSEQDLVNAFKSGQIDRPTFDAQARLLRDWQTYNKQEADRAAQPRKARPQ